MSRHACGRFCVLSAALTVGILVLSGAPAQASIPVNTEADELTPNGQCSLREAITVLDGGSAADCVNSISNPDQIDLPPGDYALTIRDSNTKDDANLKGDLDIFKSMTIQGSDPQSTSIDGDSANTLTPDRVIDVFRADVDNPTVVINDVTIKNGQAPSVAGPYADGGGIMNGGHGAAATSDLTLNDVVVKNNAAGEAASGNFAGNGGGIASSAPLTVNSSTISGNHAGDAGTADLGGGSGGGIYQTGSAGALSVTASTISGNRAGNAAADFRNGGSGGGILDFATVASTVSSSTITGNHAGNGTGDTASGGSGGGIWTGNAAITLTADTIASNGVGTGTTGGSDGTGGGISLSSGSVFATIIASNTPENCGSQTFTDAGENIGFGDTTCGAGFATGDPNLSPLNDNGGMTETMAPAAPSAALDQYTTNCPGFDQRGIDRPQNGTCDIGAFELRSLNLSVARTGSGSGGVTSSPVGIDCGATCDANYDEQTAITLTATPAADSRFTGWSGGGCSGTGACHLTLSGDTVVTARFAKKAVAPDTKISKAKIDSKAGKATFEFKSVAGAKAKAISGFQCSLAKQGKDARFTACDSPQKYKHLKPAKYTFQVRAFNAGGKDATPATKAFKIKRK